jgi:hypothetical protein
VKPKTDEKIGEREPTAAIALRSSRSPPRGSGQKNEQSIKKKESLYCSGLAVLFVQLNRLSIVEQRTTTRRGTQGSSCSHSGSDPKTDYCNRRNTVSYYPAREQ